jgi:beta-glucosidase
MMLRKSIVVLGLCGMSLTALLSIVLAQETLTAPRFEIPATDDGLPGAGPIRRSDWMQQIWNTRRTEFARRHDADKNAIVFFGDSITQGWNDDFRGDFDALKKSEYKLSNQGIGGDTTRGMLIRLDDDVLSLDPTAVVMLMGTNDLADDASPDTIASNIGLIIDRMHAHDASMPIILCLVMPSSEKKDRSANDIRDINSRLQELAKGNDQVTVVDTWTIFAGDDGNAKIEEFPDLLHPNKAGYAKWRDAMLPVFQKLGFAK